MKRKLNTKSHNSSTRFKYLKNIILGILNNKLVNWTAQQAAGTFIAIITLTLFTYWVFLPLSKHFGFVLDSIGYQELIAENIDSYQSHGYEIFKDMQDDLKGIDQSTKIVILQRIKQEDSVPYPSGGDIKILLFDRDEIFGTKVNIQPITISKLDAAISEIYTKDLDGNGTKELLVKFGDRVGGNHPSEQLLIISWNLQQRSYIKIYDSTESDLGLKTIQLPNQAVFLATQSGFQENLDDNSFYRVTYGTKEGVTPYWDSSIMLINQITCSSQSIFSTTCEENHLGWREIQKDENENISMLKGIHEEDWKIIER